MDREDAAQPSLWRRLELPTWGVAVAVYAGWLAVTAYFSALPLWIAVPLGGALVTWHGSLQHETIHRHPTRRAWVNALVGGWPLALWLPYGVYRNRHAAHHLTADIADPIADPESFYVAPARWARMGPVRRALAWAQATLVGRLVLGPVAIVAAFFADEAKQLARGDLRDLGHLAWHAAGVAVVLAWAVGVCGIPLWVYALAFVYPGLSLTLLRSYAEHRPAEQRPHRTAIVEASPVFGLLFLNNNLHVVHHDRPGLPWYELPGRYRRDRDAVLVKNGGYRIDGYWALLRRYGWRPKHAPVHSMPVDPVIGGGRREVASAGR